MPKRNERWEYDSFFCAMMLSVVKNGGFYGKRLEKIYW